MGWRARRRQRRSESGGSGAPTGDPFETSDVRIIPAGDPPADQGNDQDDDQDGDEDATGELADESVLAELSDAFSDDPPVDEDASDDAPRTTISIGGDDELPDIAYLDDALAEDDDDSGTVFIDDDGRSDAMQPSAAGAATVDARMRQRRIGVRKAANRRRLFWLAGVAVVVMLVIGVLALLGSGWFAVKDVTVLGQTYADPTAVDEVVADLEGTPVLLVDTGELEDRLEAIAWVETARVSTDFPNSATIELREREPVATVQGSDLRFRILDREGRVLDVIDGQAVALVLVTGPDPVDLLPGQFADVGHAAAAALVTKLTPDVRARLVSIETTADGRDMGLVLLAADGEGPDIVVRLGEAVGDNDQIEKLVRLERVLDDADGAGVTQIDVSTAETTQR